MTEIRTIEAYLEPTARPARGITLLTPKFR